MAEDAGVKRRAEPLAGGASALEPLAARARSLLSRAT
jgi:hypothetical protein